MKLGIVKSSRKATRHSPGRKSCAFVPKIAKSKKEKKLMYEGGKISKLDAQVIIGLVKEPFRPNDATIEARQLGKSIRRLSVH